MVIKMKILLPVVFLIFFSSFANAQDIVAKAVALGSVNPVSLGFNPGDDNSIFVLEEHGNLLSYKLKDNGLSTKSEVFLSVAPSESFQSKKRMIDFAFNPNSEDLSKVVISYILLKEGKPSFVVSELSQEKKGKKIKASSERIIFVLELESDEYAGGGLLFDSEGLLYVGIGDGASQNDIKGNAQNKNNTYGSLIKIDIEQPEGALEYVPALDNPFMVNKKGSPEIYAYGLRDPHSFSFDKMSKQFWLVDRGHKKFDEVNLVTSGGNYGWNIYNGSECLEMRFECLRSKQKPPRLSYRTPDKTANLVSGHVYRGSSIPKLYGKYLFAESSSGQIFQLEASVEKPSSKKLLLDTGSVISNFAANSKSDPYFSDFKSGKIYKLVSKSGNKGNASKEMVDKSKTEMKTEAAAGGQTITIKESNKFVVEGEVKKEVEAKK